MVLVFVSLTVLFLFISLLTNYVTTQQEILLSYLLNIFYFFLSYPLLLVLFLFAIFFIGHKLGKVHKHYSRLHTYSLAFLNGVMITGIAMFVSGVIIALIAIIQLNFLAMMLDSTPGVLGVVSDRDKILNVLKTNNIAPEIITGDVNQHQELLAIAKATAGTNGFYGRYALPSIPSFLIYPVGRPESTFLLIDNTLIFNVLQTQDIESVSPTLAYLYVKQYFWGRNIKHYPNISIMTRNDYIVYRKNDNDKKAQLADANRVKVESTIQTLTSQIQQDQQAVQADTNGKEQRVNQRNDEYGACLNTNTEGTCKNLVTNQMQQDNNHSASLSARLLADQKQLGVFKNLDTVYKTQKLAFAISDMNVAHELGAFIPDNSIRIAFGNAQSSRAADYIETLIHEYLHYASYQGKNKLLSDSFFEEGLTEYFARRIVEDNLHIETNLGYPAQVKIIEAMTKRIDESELADIYFSKDENHLESSLNRVYGDNFYQNNRVLFDTLQFSSDPKQTLKLTNDILEKIGGTPVTQTDITSNLTNLAN